MFNFFRKRTWKQWFQEGMTHGGASAFSKAEACFREAARLAPNEPYPHYELGYTLFLLGRHEEALGEFRKTDQLARGFFLVQTEMYMCEQFLAGRIRQDVLSLLRELQQLVDQGQVHSGRAVELSRKVIALAPTCALGHFYLGKSLLHAEPVKAMEAFQRCLEHNPDETTAIDARFHMGVLHKQSGQETLARQQWQEIVTTFAGNPHIKFAEMNLAVGTNNPETSG